MAPTQQQQRGSGARNPLSEILSRDPSRDPIVTHLRVVRENSAGARITLTFNRDQVVDHEPWTRRSESTVSARRGRRKPARCNHGLNSLSNIIKMQIFCSKCHSRRRQTSRWWWRPQYKKQQ